MATSAYALPLDTAPMEAKAADALPDDRGLGYMSRSGMGSGALPSSRAMLSIYAPNPASHSAAISLNLSPC
jgi:hypothetical protein